MKTFANLLVGVELDEQGQVTQGSRRAALQAQRLAEVTGASISFLHSNWSDLYEDGERLRERREGESVDALEELVSDYTESGTKVDRVVVYDRPWIELVRRAVRGETDLVLVGRRNAPGSHAFGSTAQKLIRNCPVPVWVVKPDAELVHHAVLAATDLSAVGDRAVELGAFVARTHDCALHVAHAWQASMGQQLHKDGGGAGPQQAAEEHIRALLERVAPDLKPHVHIAKDSPSRLIRQGVKELKAELLVLGTLSRSGVPGLLVGNTSERVLSKVECSVLTLKPEDFVSPIR